MKFVFLRKEMNRSARKRRTMTPVEALGSLSVSVEEQNDTDEPDEIDIRLVKKLSEIFV